MSFSLSSASAPEYGRRYGIMRAQHGAQSIKIYLCPLDRFQGTPSAPAQRACQLKPPESESARRCPLHQRLESEPYPPLQSAHRMSADFWRIQMTPSSAKKTGICPTARLRFTRSTSSRISSRRITNAVPRTGCPAKGTSTSGINILTLNPAVFGRV